MTAYLQLTRNLFPAPSKKCSKYNFVDFEMINKEGERFAIIVKSENDTINLEEMCIRDRVKAIKIELSLINLKVKHLVIHHKLLLDGDATIWK